MNLEDAFLLDQTTLIVILCVLIVLVCAFGFLTIDAYFKLQMILKDGCQIHRAETNFSHLTTRQTQVSDIEMGYVHFINEKRGQNFDRYFVTSSKQFDE